MQISTMLVNQKSSIAGAPSNPRMFGVTLGGKTSVDQAIGELAKSGFTNYFQPINMVFELKRITI